MDRHKQIMQGMVISTKMTKTATVQVTRTVKHRKYHKFLKRHSNYHFHDEKNECQVGDFVSIIESKPISKLKRWRLREIIQKVEV